ncbi:VWA domain-containing protein [Planctomycetes bacterium Pla163]
MQPSPILRVLLVALFAATAASAPHALAAPGVDPRMAAVEAFGDRYSGTFEKWARRDADALARVDPGELESLLDKSFTVTRSRRADVDLALLELLGSCRAGRTEPRIEVLHRAVLGALTQRLTGRGGTGFEDWLRLSVLAPEAVEDVSAVQRASACHALAALMRPPLVTLLAATASGDPDPTVRGAALDALTGQPSRLASEALLAAAIERDAKERSLARLLLADHLSELESAGSLASAWDDTLGARLVEAALPMLVDEDWRVASRGVRLARHCEFEAAAPRCIEALFAWERRETVQEEATGLIGMRRVRHELADLLRAGSGLKLGIEPRRWTQWWRGHLAGDERPRVSSRTVVPDFYGLELRSGAVAFVIDASGSMDHPIPGRYADNDGPTRFEEACDQLELALQRLPTPGAFQVVLFSDTGERWSDEPRLVSDTSRSSIRKWLRRNPPGGGTNLSAGLDALLPRDADGRRRADLLAVDTVVVLCDGQTAEDARWARAWLAAYNESAGLVFHCVQIGGGDAFALEELAKRTGGTFVRVGR